MPYLLLFILLFQDSPTVKPTKEFEVKTDYQLKKKPTEEPIKIVFEKTEVKRNSNTDLLPFLSINLKVKKWEASVTHVKAVDSQNKTIAKTKAGDEEIFRFDIGYVDDIKDKITSGKFTVLFLAKKKSVEQIQLLIDEEGNFFVNGEKRGKF